MATGEPVIPFTALRRTRVEVIVAGKNADGDWCAREGAALRKDHINTCTHRKVHHSGLEAVKPPVAFCRLQVKNKFCEWFNLRWHEHVRRDAWVITRVQA